MKQSLIFLLFTLISAKLFAFPMIPSEFHVEKDGIRMKISCKQKVDPIASFSNIKKIDDFLDCNNKPIAEYCECIAKKFEGKPDLTPDQERTLETELGLFGTSQNVQLTRIGQEIASNQQILRMYGDDKDQACLDIEKDGPHHGAYQKIVESTSNTLSSIKKTDSETPAYVNSKYIDEAIVNQGIIRSGEDVNFANELNHDYNFLKYAAGQIALSNPQILLGSKKDRDRIKDFNADGSPVDPALKDQYENGEFLVPWQKELKKSIENPQNIKGDFSNSPVFNSMQRAFQSFGPFEDGNYTGDKQVYFEKMVQAIKRIGFSESDLKKIGTPGESIDDTKYRDKLGDNPFKRAMKSFALEHCKNSGNILLQEVKTNLIGGKRMNAYNEGFYRMHGRRLINNFLNIDPTKFDGAGKLRALSSLQNRMFSQMTNQFKHLENQTDKDKQDIMEYVLSKKDQMGRLWCGANYVSKHLESMKKHVEENAEDNRRFLEADLTVKELERQKAMVQTDSRKLESKLLQIEVVKLEMGRQITANYNEMEAIRLKIKDLKKKSGTGAEVSKLKAEYEKLEALVDELTSASDEEELKLQGLVKVIKEKEKISRYLTSAIEKVRENSVQNYKANETAIASRSRGKTKAVIEEGLPAVGVTLASLNNRFSFNVEAIRDFATTKAAEKAAEARKIFEAKKPAAGESTGFQSRVEDIGTNLSLLANAGNVDDIINEQQAALQYVGLPRVKLYDRKLDEESVLVVDVAGKMIVSNVAKETIKEVKAVEENLERISESTDKGVRPEIPSEVLASAGAVISNMVNNASDNLQRSSASEEVKAAHKEKVIAFEEKIEKVVGPLNFTAKGEYEAPKKIRDIVEDSMESNKSFKRMASMGRKPIEPTRTTPVEVEEPVKVSPMDFLSKAEVPVPFIAPTVKTPVEVKKNRFSNTVSVAKGSSSKIKAKLDSLSSAEINAILSKRMTSRAVGKKTDLIAKKPLKKVVDPRIQKLRDEIKRNKELSQKLDSQIQETEVESTALRGKSNPLFEKKSLAAATPNFEAPASGFIAPAKTSRTGSTGGGRSPASVKSFGGGSLGGSSASGNSAASSAAIEGRVSGGVVVNGEFIPSSLLARNIDIDGIKPAAAGSIVLSSKSSYELKPAVSKSIPEGTPRVKSISFSSLSDDKKEEFIQRELLRLKTNTIIIENSDGSEVVVKSKVKLRTRMKVANLNALFEKVDE